MRLLCLRLNHQIFLSRFHYSTDILNRVQSKKASKWNSDYPNTTFVVLRIIKFSDYQRYIQKPL
ncbi:hypothetical protein T01_13223, partial [Trichinella spiralis]